MRNTLPGLVIVVAFAITILSFLAVSPTPAGRIPLHASSVNINLNYSDPANDVAVLWTSNNSHVTNAGGFWVFSANHPSVDLLRLSSTNSSTSIAVYLKVRSTIAILPNTTYQFSLYPRLDNSTHYVVTYHDGTTTMVTNHTGSSTWNLTARTQVGNLGWLGVNVSMADLGGPANISAWNIDATSKQVSGNYTYEDFVWQQPGNPGSAPAFIQGRVTDAASGAGLANVNVSVGAAGYFTHTNATGYYSLPASPGNFTMSFSLFGYDTATKQVTVQYQQTQTVNAQLAKPSLLTSSTLWILVAVILVSVALVAFLVLRRKKPEVPK